MPARKNLRHNDESRARIRTTQLLRRLQQFALGTTGDQGEVVKLNANEIRAIEILLKKRLPDLTSVEHTGEIEYKHTSELSDQDLERIATGGGAGTAEPTQGPQQPPPVH